MENKSLEQFEKTCPISDTECRGNFCAWYVDIYDCCSVWKIASTIIEIQLDDVGDAKNLGHVVSGLEIVATAVFDHD